MASPAPLTMVVVVAGVLPPTDAAQSQFGGGGKQQKQKSLKLKMPALFFSLQPLPSRTSELFVLILCFGLGFIPSGRGDLWFWPGTKKRHDDGAKGRGAPPRFGNEGETQQWSAP